MMEAGQQLMDWLAEQQAQSHRIWLEEPEVVKEGGMLSKSYVRYTICYMQEGNKLVRVKHRYSEFEMVQQALVAMYGPLGMLVPAIPGKKLVNNQSSEFIVSRMRGLSIFCEQVMNNPYLRNDNLWKSFLNPNNGPFSKESIFNATNSTSIGSLRWLEAVDRSMTPPEPTLRFDQLMLECSITEKNMKALADALRSYSHSLAAVNDSVANINNALLQWVDCEGTDVTALNGAWAATTPLDEVELPKPNLSNSAQLFSAHHAAASKIPDASNFLVLDLIEYQIAQIQDLRDMAKIRNEYETSIEKLSLKLHKLEQADGSKWEQLTEVRQQLQDKSEGLLKFYRGFFNHALPEYIVERAAAVREATSTLGLLVLAPAANIQAAGQKFFKEMQLSPSNQFQEAIVVLDRLGLPPLDEFPITVAAEEVRMTAPPPPNTEQEAKSPTANTKPAASPKSKAAESSTASAAPAEPASPAATAENTPATEDTASATAETPEAEEKNGDAGAEETPAEVPEDTTPSRKNEIMADLLKDSKYDSKSDLWD